MEIDTFFEQLWSQSCDLCPEVAKIDELLIGHGENKIINDHVAFRTLSGKKTGLAALTPALTAMGYTVKARYRFEEKKLNAVHLEHIDLGIQAPKIFISELCLDELPPTVAAALEPVLTAIPSALIGTDKLFSAGRQWPVNWKTHKALAEISEYAGWFYAFGYIANHFTVSINHLETFKSIESVNAFLEQAGITLNSSGGKIKGSEAVHLKQSATLAFNTTVTGEQDGEPQPRQIPGIFREMAQRFVLPSGERFEGFVEGNANTIFESTHQR
jgi:hypothetical protein